MAYQGYVQARESPIRQNIGVYEGGARRQERLSKDIGTGMKELGESVKSYGVNKREQTKLQFFDQKRRLDTALAGHKLALTEADRKAYKTHGGRQAALDAYNKELDAWRKESSTPTGVSALNPADIGRRYSIFGDKELSKYVGKATDQIAKVSPMTFGEWLTARDHVDTEWLNRDHGATLSVIKEVISEIQGRDVGDMFDKVGVKSASGTDSGSVVEETADGEKEPPPAEEEVVLKEGIDEVITGTSGENVEYKGRSGPQGPISNYTDTSESQEEEESIFTKAGNLLFSNRREVEKTRKENLEKKNQEEGVVPDDPDSSVLKVNFKTADELSNSKDPNTYKGISNEDAISTSESDIPKVRLKRFLNDPESLKGEYIRQLLDSEFADKKELLSLANALKFLASGNDSHSSWKRDGKNWEKLFEMIEKAKDPALANSLRSFNQNFRKTQLTN